MGEGREGVHHGLFGGRAADHWDRRSHGGGAINAAAGVQNAASAVQNNGYYLQILDPGATARNAGQTPIINFWSASGGAILSFTMSSINVL